MAHDGEPAPVPPEGEPGDPDPGTRLSLLLRSWWEEAPRQLTQEAVVRRLAQRGVTVSQATFSRYVAPRNPQLATRAFIEAMHGELGRAPGELPEALALLEAAERPRVARQRRPRAAGPAAPARAEAAATGPAVADPREAGADRPVTAGNPGSPPGRAPEPGRPGGTVSAGRTPAAVPGRDPSGGGPVAEGTPGGPGPDTGPGAPLPAPRPAADLPAAPVTGAPPAASAPSPRSASRRRRWFQAAGAAATGLAVVTGVVLALVPDDRGNDSAAGSAPPPPGTPAPASGGPANAATCHGESCLGLDPKAARCDDPRTLVQFANGGQVVELRYSRLCGAAWTKITFSGVGDLAEIRDARGRGERRPVSVKTDTFSPMLPAPSGEPLTACGTAMGRTQCQTAVP